MRVRADVRLRSDDFLGVGKRMERVQTPRRRIYGVRRSSR